MMKSWKVFGGGALLIGLLLFAGCEQEAEPPKPPPPDPLTACRNECRATSEKMFKECSDRLTAEGAFDRLTECNTEADTFSKKCRAECDEKHIARKQE